MNYLSKSPKQMQTQLPSLVQVQRELTNRSFYQFVKMAWPVLFPTTPFIDNWHIKLICENLQALYEHRFENNNLILNVPPRCGKSFLSNIFWFCWIISKDPSKKFLYVHQREDLAHRDSGYCRELISSPWYQQRWNVQFKRDQNQLGNFGFVGGGFRKCFGIRSGITGEGGDLIVCDDLNVPGEGESDRNHTNFIFDTAIANRYTDPKKVIRLCQQQRIHVDDITGHLLAEQPDQWEKCILPMEYEPHRYISSIGLNDPRTTENELLWPQRFGQKEVDYEKATRSELDYNCQYQCRPSLMSGNVMKREWFEPRIENDSIMSRWISVDTAIVKSASADFTAIIVGEITSELKLFIRYVWLDKLEFTELQNKLEEIAEKYKYKLERIVIEAKGSGYPLAQSMEKTSPEWMKPLIFTQNPIGEKIDRAQQAALFCEKKCVLLPPHNQNNEWLYEFEKQWFGFPQEKHDDAVDATSQLINYLDNYLEQGLIERSQN